MAGVSQNRAVASTNIVPAPEWALRRFRSIPLSTARKMAWVGDSTTLGLLESGQNVVDNVSNSYSTGLSLNPSLPFYNITHYVQGNNGMSVLSWLANSAYLTAVVAESPDLIVFSFGLNDVRLGTQTKDQLKANLILAIQRMQAAMPNADIIMRMPNAILYDSANTGSLIDTPISLEKVQDYSDRIRNAHLECIDGFDHVYLLNTQQGEGKIWNATVNTLANKGKYMTDAFHPSSQGYKAMVREVAFLLGDYGKERFGDATSPRASYLPKYSEYACDNAVNINSTDPHLIYPRIVENPRYYNKIIVGRTIANIPAGQDHFTIASNELAIANELCEAVIANEIIIQYGVDPAAVAGSQGEIIDELICAWKKTTANTSQSGTNMWLTSVPTGYPKAQLQNGLIGVYRRRPSTQKNDYDPNFSAVLAAADFTLGTLTHIVQRFGVVSVLTGVATTGPTTGGTIDVKKNGTTFATLTFANDGTTATVSGTFVGTNTKGIWFDEGDIITAVINAGFVGGTFPKITLANHS